MTSTITEITRYFGTGKLSISEYRSDPIYLERQVWANIVDPDQNAPDQGLHFLPFCLYLLKMRYTNEKIRGTCSRKNINFWIP